MDTSGLRVVEKATTASYCALMDADGDLVTAIADMNVLDSITPELVGAFQDQILAAPLVVVDGNVPIDSLEYLCSICGPASVPVWFEPTSLDKAQVSVRPPLRPSLSLPLPVCMSLLLTLTLTLSLSLSLSLSHTHTLHVAHDAFCGSSSSSVFPSIACASCSGQCPALCSPISR